MFLDKWEDFLDWYYYNTKKFWFILFLLLSVIVLISFFSREGRATESYFQETKHEFIEPDSETEKEVVKYVEHPDVIEEKLLSNIDSISVLLLGVDSRDNNFVGRSDSMMLLTSNKDDKSIKLVNIPRDSYVWISGKGFRDKINHAHAFGSSLMAEKTVEDLFGIDIDHVITINFDSFEKVIDLFGGVEVDVPFTFTENDTKGNVINFNKGSQVLNGEEALAYVRMRKQDSKGDLGRGERQQEVIESLIKEVASFSSVTKVKGLYDLVKNNVKTDIGLSEILELIPHIKNYDNIEKLTLGGKSKKIKGIYYYELDKDILNDTVLNIQRHLGQGKTTKVRDRKSSEFNTPNLETENNIKKERENKLKIEQLARDKEALELKNKLNSEKAKKIESNRLAEEKRLAEIEAEKLAQIEADRIAKDKADKLAKDKADKLAKDEADRLAKAEADKLAKDEADRLEKEELDRLESEDSIESNPGLEDKDSINN